MGAKRRFIGGLAMACAALAAPGCAQEDPDAGAGGDAGQDHPPWVWQCDEPGSGGSPEESHFPVADGSRWSIHRFGGLQLDAAGTLVPDQDAWENITLEKVDYQGRAALLFQDTPNRKGHITRNWMIQEGDAILRAHQEEYDGDDFSAPILAVDYYLGIARSEVPDIDDYENGFKRFDPRWLEQAPGWAETTAYNRKATLDLTGTEGKLNKETVRVHRFEVESTDETVTVPAGTFEHCLKLKRERVREPDDKAAESERWSDVKRFWFCPGIGKVKEAEVNDDPRVEELLYYCIPDGRCCTD